MPKKTARARAIMGVAIVVLFGFAAAAVVIGLTNQQRVVAEQVAEGSKFTATPQATQEPVPSILWVGDSFTVGTGSAPGKSYAELVSRQLGWSPRVDAQGGSGFMADGKSAVASNVPVPARLTLNQSLFYPDVVVIDAGRNDSKFPQDQLRATATKYISDVRAAWPEAKIVLVVPFTLKATRPNSLFTALYSDQTVTMGATVVNPIQEGWINPQQVTPEMIYKDDVHPSPAGHEYIANHLIPIFERLGVVASGKRPTTSTS